MFSETTVHRRTAIQLCEILLASGKDFTFETVLSTNRNLKLLERAKERGYEIYVIFVLTNDSRIRIRMNACGHDL